MRREGMRLGVEDLFSGYVLGAFGLKLFRYSINS